MAQIKIFKSIEPELSDLETQVNTWLKESGAKVLNVFGNISPQTVLNPATAAGGRTFGPSDVMLVVLYE